MDRSNAVAEFVYNVPSVDSYWRAIVLFGRNVASYKFALATALLDLACDSDQEVFSLEEIAVPYATALARHLRTADKQATFKSGRFLDNCRAFNRGELDLEGLKRVTVRDGFQYVVDAFHILDDGEVPEKFYIDERKLTAGGLRVTDNLRTLIGEGYESNLREEIEGRWRLVETAWELNLPRQLLTVEFEPITETIVVPAVGAPDKRRRRNITSARAALDGYQKGHCFYCFSPIEIATGSSNICHVDHFFAWSAGSFIGGAPVDGIWNLVLACAGCNGWHSKSGRPPHETYVDRLCRRSETLIASHHPLRPTLISQTGHSPELRIQTLKRAMDQVSEGGARERCRAPEEMDPAF